MSTPRWLAFTFAIAFGFTVQAADSPLSQISNEADVVIRIRAFDTTVQNIAALANAVQPGAGDMVSQNATLFGPIVSNPALSGVDRTKDFYLVLFMREEGEPKALFAIPTTDGPALQKALPENFESQVREDWVFYADKDHGVPPAVSAAESLATLMAKSVSANEVFEKSDVGLHINVSHIADIYNAQILEARLKFEEGIQKGLNTPGVENAESVVEILKLGADMAFKLLEDTETFTIGVNASESGLVIEDYIDFQESSDIAAFLKKQPKSKFTALTKLGAGLPLYMGISAEFAELAQATEKFTALLYKDEAVRQGMKDYIGAMKTLQITSAVMSFDLASGTKGMLRTTGVFETKKAAELLATGRKFATLSKSITVGEMTQETTLVPDAETVGTHKIDLMTITQKVDPNQPGAATQAMITGLMFGAKGMQTRMTALADGYLQVQGGDKDTMGAAIKAYEAKSNSLTEARAGMADESHLLMLLDLPGLVRNGMLAATTINIPGFAIPFQRAAVEDLQISPSYTAVTAVGEEHAVRIKTKVPVEQFQGVLKLVGFAQSIHGR